MSSMSSCSGASMGGAVTHLLAQGVIDTLLTRHPTITFWRFRYNQYTNFALESIEQSFNTQVGFGSEAQVILNRTGDLIYWQYCVISLPGISACEGASGICGIGGNIFPCCDSCDPTGDGPEPDCICPVPSSVPTEDAVGNFPIIDNIDTCTGLTEPWAHYTNAIGQWLVKRACIVIGGQIIDTLYNDYLFMWEELSGKPGKRLTEMIGKRFTRAQLVADSKKNRRLYVPLPFWYTYISGNALPIASLQFHSIQIHICFSALQSAVQVSSCDVLVVKCGTDCTPLIASDLRAVIDSTYVYLDCEERDRFATSCFEQLIVQTQALYLTTSTSQVRIQVNFNHPIIELIWAVRRRKNEVCNNWFNYSGVFGQDPVKFVALRLNNVSRFAGREGKYFRLVQPYQFHTDIPDAFIYCYSFALFPEEVQPSGACNFSRLDNVEFILDLQDELGGIPETGTSAEQVTVILFARNWNIMRYRDGIGGVAFSS